MSKVIENRCLLMENCMELFLQHGLRSVSIEDIVRNANISKKEIYSQFGNKKGIIRQVIEWDIQQMNDFFENLPSQSKNAVEEMITAHKYFLRRFKHINPVLFFDLNKYYHSINRFHRGKHKEYTSKFILANLNRGIQEQLYRESINKEIVSILWLSKIFSIQDQDVFDLRKIDFEELTSSLTELHLRSIANKKGLQLIDQFFNND